MPEDNLAIIRKRLIFRSWHRGTREMDLLLGRYADARVAEMSAAELSAYDSFLSNNDPDIYDWIIGEKVPATADENIVQDLKSFYSLNFSAAE